MPGPTNADLLTQLREVGDDVKLASATSKAALAAAKMARQDVGELRLDVGELKAWLEPLKNGAGEKITRIQVLADLAEEGQKSRTRRDTLNAAGEILFGWLPARIRQFAGAVAVAGVIFGALSSVVIVGQFIWDHRP